MTSHDVVFKARKILKTKKIGHTGTLDPNAEGVLVLCVGKATRMAEFLTEREKSYRAEICFGKATDTDDITGEILRTELMSVTVEMLEEAISHFRGQIMQVPPIYSALKKDGKKLYEYARAGERPEIAPRPITIHKIEIVDASALPDRAIIDVACSKGTYIRALCRDIGEYFGGAACMGELLRTRVGSFLLENAITLEALSRSESIEKYIYPIDYGMEVYPRVCATERGKRFLRSGNKLYPWNAKENYDDFSNGELIRLYDDDGFAGMGRFMTDEEKPYIKPIKIIPGD